MESEGKSAFSQIPPNVRGHCVLLFYAAVYQLIYYLRCQAISSGKTFDDVLKDFSFLGGYFAEMRECLPEDVNWGDSLCRIRNQIEEWQKSASPLLPLLQMRSAVNVGYEAMLAFVFVGGAEEEGQFASLFATLQPQQERRPSLGLIHRVFKSETCPDPWSLFRPLLDGGFLQVVNSDAPRSDWVLRIPSVLWNVVRGDTLTSILPGARYHPVTSLEASSALVVDTALRGRITELESLLVSRRTRSVVIRGLPGTDRLGVGGSLAHALGRGMIEIECPATTSPSDERWRLLGPLCTLAHCMPVFSIDVGPGEKFDIPVLNGYTGPCCVLLGKDGGVAGSPAEHAITLQLEIESPAERFTLWKRALNGQSPPNLEEIAASFCLPARYIRQCAELASEYAALDGRIAITPADIQHAARTLNRQLLDTLATRIESPASWSHLVVRPATSQELLLLERRCRHRESLLAAFDGNMPGGLNRGVRILFEGPSGTGKTLAARVLATELGLDLYRVDLAAVVNKYVGESEKNLSRLFARAEDLNVVLLLDEGDALMARRTEVKSANDRYANLETNYLLQRLENYTGVVIVTTNAGHNIDSSFRRRFDCVIKFRLPDAAERWRLWQIHLPPDHRIPEATLEEIAVRYPLTGGQIRNIMLHAALLGISRDDSLRPEDLHEAIQVEHRKAGASFTGQPAIGTPRNAESLTAFLGGLS
jgi:hypothetical protein